MRVTVYLIFILLVLPFNLVLTDNTKFPGGKKAADLKITAWPNRESLIALLTKESFVQKIASMRCSFY